MARRHHLPLLLALSACATLTNLESPRTLPPGEWQVGLEARMIATRSAPVHDEQNAFHLVVRRGITDGFEAGARAGFGRPELFGKWRLTGGDPARTAVAVSEAFGVLHYGGQTPHWQLWSRTALPIGVPLGRGFDLVLAPVVHFVSAFSESGLWAIDLLPAASVGVRWAGVSWSVMPQVTAGTSLVSVGTGGSQLGGGYAFEAGLAVGYGGL